MDATPEDFCRFAVYVSPALTEAASIQRVKCKSCGRPWSVHVDRVETPDKLYVGCSACQRYVGLEPLDAGDRCAACDGTGAVRAGQPQPSDYAKHATE